jgi:hypothetical protein
MVPLAVGQVLYGHCGGLFDESFEDKRIEAIGVDWIVAREMESGRPVFADNDRREDPVIPIHHKLAEYTKPEEI